MGTATASPSTQTALERHAAFFDPQGTGVIRWQETYGGTKRLGVPLYLRIPLTPIINVLLGSRTAGRFSTVIRLDRIALGLHPYDSGSFDDWGRFDPTWFDALFPTADSLLTAQEMDAAVTARKNRRPQMGKLAGTLGHWLSAREIGVLFVVAADQVKIVDGKRVPAMSKARLQSFYDGTLFYEIAHARARAARA